MKKELLPKYVEEFKQACHYLNQNALYLYKYQHHEYLIQLSNIDNHLLRITWNVIAQNIPRTYNTPAQLTLYPSSNISIVPTEDIPLYLNWAIRNQEILKKYL